MSGEIVDPQQPFGAVFWQEPLPGVRQTKPPQADLLVAVAPEPRCAARQLAGRYLNAGNRTGNHFGNIVLLDSSSLPCRLSGRITLTGLDQAGHPDTVAATETLEPPLVLSPHAIPRAVLTRPSSTLAAIFGFAAEVRDDPRANGGLCYSHESYPATWSLRLGRQAPLRFADGGPGSGGRFLTCHGNFGFTFGSPFGLSSWPTSSGRDLLELKPTATSTKRRRTRRYFRAPSCAAGELRGALGPSPTLRAAGTPHRRERDVSSCVPAPSPGGAPLAPAARSKTGVA